MGDFKNISNRQGNPIRANDNGIYNLHKILFASEVFDEGNLDIDKQVFKTDKRNISFINKLWNYQGDYDVVLNESPVDLSGIVQDISIYPALSFVQVNSQIGKSYSILLKRKKLPEVLPVSFTGNMKIHCDTVFSPELTGNLEISDGEVDLRGLHVTGRVILNNVSGVIDVLRIFNSTGSPAIELNNCSDLVIKNVEVITSDTGIYLNWCTNITVMNYVHTENTGSSGSIYLDVSDENVFRNIYLSDIQKAFHLSNSNSNLFEDINLKDVSSFISIFGSNSGNKGINISESRGNVSFAPVSGVNVDMMLNGYSDNAPVLTLIQNSIPVYSERSNVINFNKGIRNLLYKKKRYIEGLPNDIYPSVNFNFKDGIGSDVLSISGENHGESFVLPTGLGFTWDIEGALNNFSIVFPDNLSSVKIPYSSDFDFQKGFTWFFVIKPGSLTGNQTIFSRFNSGTLPSNASYRVMQSDSKIRLEFFSEVKNISGVDKELLIIETDDLLELDKFVGIGITYSPLSNNISVTKNQKNMNFSILTPETRNYSSINDFDGLKITGNNMHIGNTIYNSETATDNTRFLGKLSYLAMTNEILSTREIKEIFRDMNLVDNKVERKVYGLKKDCHIEIRPVIDEENRVIPSTGTGVIIDNISKAFSGALIVRVGSNNILKTTEYSYDENNRELTVNTPVVKGDFVKIIGGIKESV